MNKLSPGWEGAWSMVLSLCALTTGIAGHPEAAAIWGLAVVVLYVGCRR